MILCLELPFPTCLLASSVLPGDSSAFKFTFPLFVLLYQDLLSCFQVVSFSDQSPGFLFSTAQFGRLFFPFHLQFFLFSLQSPALNLTLFPLFISTLEFVHFLVRSFVQLTGFWCWFNEVFVGWFWVLTRLQSFVT